MSRASFCLAEKMSSSINFSISKTSVGFHSFRLSPSSMAHPGFGHLWRHADMSDVQIVLSVVNDTYPAKNEAPEAQNSNRRVLQQFPGHSQILSLLVPMPSSTGKCQRLVQSSYDSK